MGMKDCILGAVHGTGKTIPDHAEVSGEATCLDDGTGISHPLTIHRCPHRQATENRHAVNCSAASLFLLGALTPLLLGYLLYFNSAYILG